MVRAFVHAEHAAAVAENADGSRIARSGLGHHGYSSGFRCLLK
jgi:hypothetical protein